MLLMILTLVAACLFGLVIYLKRKADQQRQASLKAWTEFRDREPVRRTYPTYSGYVAPAASSDASSYPTYPEPTAASLLMDMPYSISAPVGDAGPSYDPTPSCSYDSSSSSFDSSSYSDCSSSFSDSSSSW